MQFHIGRIYLKYLQDYASAKNAFLLVLHDYPAAEIANHPFLDRLRGGPGSIKLPLTDIILSTPITIDVLGIKFDYDHNSNANDAVDIKVDASTDIAVPEWTTFGETNEKIAYIKNSSSRKIKAQFWCDLDNNYWKIGADVLNGTGFGDLPSIWVEFPTGHISSYVTYTADGTVPGNVGIRNFRWNWYVWWGLDTHSLPKSSAAQKLSVETTGPHYYYTLLSSPQNPESEPRADILDYACDWASGASNSSTVCTDILENGFDEHYDWDYQCHRLSSDFVRLVTSLGVSASQHRWASKNLYTGDMAYQRTRSFNPVGPSHGTGVYEWSWHQWSEAAGAQRDPSAAVSISGNWGTYEDWLFTHYLVTGNSWVANQSGQSSGCEAPEHRYYTNSPTIYTWYGPYD